MDSDVMDMASDDFTLLTLNDMHISSFPVMEDLRRQGKLCDVTLKVDNQRYTAHKIVLAATIPYFHAMFSHDMVESKQKEISIQGIDPNAFESLINFAYSGRLKMDIHNVQALLVGASFLQLQVVRDECCNFLQKRLHPHNVIGIRHFADTLGCSTLVDSTNKFIQKHFVEVCKSDEFMNLPFKDIYDIIGRDELHVPNEELVFEVVMLWVTHHVETRNEYLPQLLTSVRMPFLTPQFLSDKVVTEELIKSSHQCRDLIDEAKDYHLMPERRHLVQSFRTKQRLCTDIMGLIYAVGGLTKAGDSLSTVEVYNPETGKWQMAEAMKMLRSRVGVAVMKNKLYAIGGYDGSFRLSTVEVFDPENNIWNKVASMNCKRSAVGAASLFDRLYVCGGYDGASSLNSVECYSPDKNEWSKVTGMRKHRSASGVVAFEGYIYAMGGHNGLSIFDSVERFDIKAGLWMPMPSMQAKRCRLGATTLGGKVYVCGGYDGATFLETSEVYDPIIGKWKYIAPMNVKRSRVALVANCGKLYAIGGYDGTSNLSTVEVYSPKTNTWTFVAPMCAHEGGVGVGVVPIV